MKEEKFKNLKLFLAMLGICFSLPAMAVEYEKTLEVKTPDTTLQVSDLALTPLGQETILTRIKVKNGFNFFVELPENHQIDQLDGGVLEGNKIRVSSAGSLGFCFVLNQATYAVLAHVNYFGVLQFNGGDAPGMIEVTEGNEDSLLSVPSGKFPGIAWFNDSYEELSYVPRGTESVSLSDLLRDGNTAFKVRFVDGTSNDLPDGSAGGVSEYSIRLVDMRTPTYTVSLSALPAEGGSVSGAGTFVQDTTVTVRAVANHGWHFLYWQQNGTTVSSDSLYSFVVTGNTALVAVFGVGSALDKLSPRRTQATLSEGRLSIYSNSAATISMYDTNGKVLIQCRIEAGDTTIPLNVPRGTYLLKVNGQTYKLLY